MKQLLTVPQVAKLLQVSDEQVRRLIRTGALQGMKIGQWRVKQEDLASYTEGGKDV